MMQRYLMKLPQREYQNNMDNVINNNIQGLFHQLKQSWYAFIGQEGFESEGPKRQFM